MADLFTVTELSSFLQRDLDPSSAVVAQQAGQGFVRAYARQNFDSRTDTAQGLVIREATGVDARDMRLSASKLPRLWSTPLVVRIPQRPVTAISAVVINGVTLTQNVDWVWDQVTPKILLSRVPWASNVFQAWPAAFVTYTAGYATIPADVKGIALAVAGRIYDNPRGIRSRAIGDYQETFAGGNDMFAGAGLLTAERRTLDRYRNGTSSVGGR